MEVKSLLVKFGTDVKAMEDGFKKADGLIQKHSEKIKKAGKIMAVAGAAIVGVIGLTIKKYADAGDEIGKMAKRTGFSCEALSELKYAAEISGTSIGSLEKGVKKMATSIGEAELGLKTYTDAFKLIGIEVKELQGLSPEEQFMKMAAGIAEIEDPTQRAYAAQKLLGKAGTELLPLFAEGAEGMAALREEAHRLGFVFDEEAAAKAEKLKDAQTDLKVALQGVAFTLADTLVPAITDLVGKIAITIAKVKDWVKEHPILAEMLMKIVGGLGLLATVMGPILIMLPGMAVGVKMLGAAFHTALGPIGLITVAIVAAGAALNAWINAKKKALDADMETIRTDKTLAEMHKLRRKAIEEGIMTQQEWAAEVNKFGKDYKAFLTAVSTAPEYETLRGELESIRKVEEDLGEETKEQTAAMIAEKLRLAEAIKAANEKITGLTKTMVGEIKKATLSEYEYSKWALEQKLIEREAAIESEKAGDAEKNKAIATARQAHNAELATLEEDHAAATEEKQKTLTANIKQIWGDYFAAAKAKYDEHQAAIKAKQDAHLAEQATLVDSINQLEMDKFTYANWLLDERYKKEQETSTNLELLWTEYNAEKLRLAEEEEEDEAAMRKKALENTLANIGMVLSTIGSLFNQHHQNRMTEIDQEEERRIDAINTMYNAQIAALEGIVAAEEAKTKAVLDSINREYDDKRQHILDNMEDNEERDLALAELEQVREDRLAQALLDREAAEQAAIDAVVAMEDTKNTALEGLAEDLEIARAKERKKAAKQEKAVALLSAIVNTAAAVSKALPNVPLAIAVGILGAIQIAIIKATPLPLGEGGIVMQPTQALIGERGPEAVIPLNKLGAFGGLQPAPVYVKMSLYNYGDINNVGDLDEISDRFGRRLQQQLERGRR